MESIIEKVIDKLKSYHDANFTYTDDSVTVHPKDKGGFQVSMDVGLREIIISSDFWHEHFDKEEESEALNCFSFMLSDLCRLRIEYKGQKPKKWTIESFVDGEWKSESTTGTLDIQFWKSKRVEYKQNKIIRTKDN